MVRSMLANSISPVEAVNKYHSTLFATTSRLRNWPKQSWQHQTAKHLSLESSLRPRKPLKK